MKIIPSELPYLSDVFLIVFAALTFLFIIKHINLLYTLLYKSTQFLNYPAPKIPISIIIYSQNQLNYLKTNLPLFLNQKYHEFEVLVVNDSSVDDTEFYLNDLEKEYPHLKKILIQEDPVFAHTKKYATLIGVKTAKFEHMIFTDSYSIPETDLWLQTMSLGFANNKQVVLGFSSYIKGKGFLNNLIRYDLFIRSCRYLTAAINNQFYIGLGMNLGYTKSLFYKNKGFANHYHIPAGEDILFVNQVATKDNISVIISKEAIIHSTPKNKYAEWKHQKIQYYQAYSKLKFSTKSFLKFDVLIQILFYFILFANLLFLKNMLIVLIIILVKLTIQGLTLYFISCKTNKQNNIIFSSFYNPILLAVNVLFKFRYLTSKKIKSKNYKKYT